MRDGGAACGVGITPACAGIRHGLCAADPRRKDHPRVRGDKPAVWRAIVHL